MLLLPDLHGPFLIAEIIFLVSAIRLGTIGDPGMNLETGEGDFLLAQEAQVTAAAATARDRALESLQTVMDTAAASGVGLPDAFAALASVPRKDVYTPSDIATALFGISNPAVEAQVRAEHFSTLKKTASKFLKGFMEARKGQGEQPASGDEAVCNALTTLVLNAHAAELAEGEVESWVNVCAAAVNEVRAAQEKKSDAEKKRKKLVALGVTQRRRPRKSSKTDKDGAGTSRLSPVETPIETPVPIPAPTSLFPEKGPQKRHRKRLRQRRKGFG
jgi:hypothetical protein